jgi:glycosyltransferase involved in cell wall biosynthesis
VFDDSIYPLAEEKVNFPIDITGKIILLRCREVGRSKKIKLRFSKQFIAFKQANPNSVLFILGTGPLQSTLQNFIKENELSASVFLMGFQSNPYKWMAACDVFILSSICEGLPTVLVEAMALGKTVVSTNCPAGPDELLKGGELGYLCPVKDPKALSDAISKAVASPFNKDHIKESSQQYTVSAIVKKIHRSALKSICFFIWV